LLYILTLNVLFFGRGIIVSLLSIAIYSLMSSY